LKKFKPSSPTEEAQLSLLVGRDAVAVETVGAVLVGLRPEKMPIIMKAVKRGLGEGDMEKTEVFGESVESMTARFEG
jgi:uncharacterized protein (DUF362 family)